MDLLVNLITRSLCMCCMVELYSVYTQYCGCLPIMVDVGSSIPQSARKLGSAGDDVVIRLTHPSLSVPSVTRNKV